ncbi:TOMM precursor leader peptide-binding protein [Streptomyces sp. TRM70350]|uniref:TOMM precursor leader peptide-binding protein n=1 Tax=Streptomyces sp. TRM70350 TaxID=2856165 RepID=UPI001C471D26|nr:TOMM precursor leader peptide-binding protein [Streptomyces sp. TRM70350]MBV7699479.1 TOMM precursor leader peptide-binding protein [Streptomyces sp. TRM70350]
MTATATESAPTAGSATGAFVADVPADAPLEAGRAALQRALSARHETERPARGGRDAQGRGVAQDEGACGLPAPLVVPLGAADTLGFGHPDPYAAVRPVATVQLTARAVLIGPSGGEAGSAACGQCLAMRWQRLRSRSEREAMELGYEPRGAARWPVFTDYAVEAVWAAYRAVFTGDRTASDATASDATASDATAADRALPRVTRVDLGTLATAGFPLLPEPLCPACVRPRPDTADAARMRLGPARKPDPDGYRLRSLDSYPLPTAALANPVCGALGSDTWINPASTTTAPVAGTNFVRGYAGLNDVTWSGQANSYRTSRTLAYLEGLERYAGTHRRRGTTPVTGSYHQLADRALNPAECGFYAPETYARDHLVSPFDPDREIPWVWGHSLRDDRPILVPARLAHYGAGVDADNFVFECSNGCATGGSLEEAILHGLLELIERDAFLLAWYGRARLTEIDLDSCRGGTIRSMLDRAALHGYDVHAFDTRMDLAVPVVTALAVRRDGGYGTLSFSAAAGFDPERTVDSALSEVLTYIPHLPYQVAERHSELEEMTGDFTKVLHLKDHAQLYGLPVMTEHAREYLEPTALLPLVELYRDWEERRPRTGDLLDDLGLVRDELIRTGHDVIAVDQTTPEQHRMGLHTVSTTVPGLLPLDFGWSRQRALLMPRLRTGLRTAGRRADDLGDADIKVVPHPFP